MYDTGYFPMEPREADARLVRQATEKAGTATFLLAVNFFVKVLRVLTTRLADSQIKTLSRPVMPVFCLAKEPTDRMIY